jgi:hypothetical protein
MRWPINILSWPSPHLKLRHNFPLESGTERLNMPGFLDLPVELWDQILPHADLPRTRASKFDSDPYERFDLRQLSYLSRVNRKWYQALLPYFYTTWSYNGARHSYISLWK